MYNAKDPNNRANTPAAASAPEDHQYPQQAPYRSTSTNNEHLPSAGRVAAASTTTVSGDDILSTASDNAKPPEPAADEPTTSTVRNAPVHDSQDGLQTQQGSSLKTFVTYYVDAESMICCNGSVDGSVPQGFPYDLPGNSSAHCRYSYALQCIYTSTAYVFDPDVSGTRSSQVRRELESIDRCFGS